jgi:hypothetical protein
MKRGPPRLVAAAANSNANLADSTLTFTSTNTPRAGFADYGILYLVAGAITQPQSDVANLASVYMMGNSAAGYYGPGHSAIHARR